MKHPSPTLSLMAFAGLSFLSLLLGCRAPLPSSALEADTGASEASQPATAPVFVEAQPSGDHPTQAALDPRAEALFRCWFRSPYEYMFSSEGVPLEVGESSFGMLQAGIAGILYYGDLNTCAGELIDTPPRGYADITPITQLVGVPASFEDGHDFDFAQVDPEFVNRGRRLLPDAGYTIDGIPVGLAYERVFRRFFRLKAEALMWTLEQGIEGERTRYIVATHDKGFDGIDYLQDNYQGVLSHHGGTSWDGTTMTPAMAIGFWLRRASDHSMGACWHGLRDVLERYDAHWLAATLDTYPSAASILAGIPDPLDPI